MIRGATRLSAGALVWAGFDGPAVPRELLDAIERARRRPHDLAGAAGLAERSTWAAAFAAEMGDLRRLIGARGVRQAAA